MKALQFVQQKWKQIYVKPVKTEETREEDEQQDVLNSLFEKHILNDIIDNEDEDEKKTEKSYSSLQSQRSSTDPDEYTKNQQILKLKFNQERLQVKKFLEKEKQKEQNIQYMIESDLNDQNVKLMERLSQRKLKAPEKSLMRSLSCGTLIISNQNFKLSVAAEDDKVINDQIQNLDLERDNKIYRIVRYFNQRIDHLRNELTKEREGRNFQLYFIIIKEQFFQQMEKLEKEKWIEIDKIQKQYEELKQQHQIF